MDKDMVINILGEPTFIDKKNIVQLIILFIPPLDYIEGDLNLM